MENKKDKGKSDGFDKDLFKAMNYEYAGEMGIVDNEEMKNNEKLLPEKKKKEDGRIKGKNK